MTGILKSIRLAFGRRSKKQGAVNAVSQVNGARNVAAQVSNGERPIHRGAVISGMNDTGDKHQADNAVVVAECWDGFKKDDWRGRGSVNQGWVDRVGHGGKSFNQGIDQLLGSSSDQSVKVPS